MTLRIRNVELEPHIYHSKHSRSLSTYYSSCFLFFYLVYNLRILFYVFLCSPLIPKLLCGCQAHVLQLVCHIISLINFFVMLHCKLGSSPSTHLLLKASFLIKVNSCTVQERRRSQLNKTKMGQYRVQR